MLKLSGKVFKIKNAKSRLSLLLAFDYFYEVVDEKQILLSSTLVIRLFHDRTGS